MVIWFRHSLVDDCKTLDEPDILQNKNRKQHYKLKGIEDVLLQRDDAARFQRNIFIATCGPLVINMMNLTIST